MPDKIVDLEKLKDLQGKDELIVKWKGRIINKGQDCGETERKERKLANRMAIDGEGVLRILVSGGRRIKQRPFGAREKYCIIVPHDMRSNVMNLVHDSPVCGSYGVQTHTANGAERPSGGRKCVSILKLILRECENCGKNKTHEPP